MAYEMDAMDIQAVESKLSDVTVTAVPMAKPALPQISAIVQNISTKDTGLSKYAQLLNVIEEMGRDVRPTYSGSKSSAERLKRGIVHARILVKECLIETERSAKQ
ncbi:cyclin-dependent kinase 2-associated protein 1-like isoform X2 [Ctenocephalides felis]|uniref:cyclin-dependent kinase 2-associated protein 1-like isoform X2 n=1 Tax=Ctenocephalides felis TaxID=7515 RepID=UPI000E6E568F|nr:cyclin-dependent kinase 2-associated protein 1-like isoform X2 [Ctenocephalides felis]XP_026474572.1 cyclin-dependent kinase 2-associated protein 1-like isoform X2 [Ctenocephalides felis]XP_026476637.1 cyclin-dependent kinase 2-associated protein 1-like isoform X2 [Ctenocephalides felis]XP_026476638.1 cyclin-dependent kinase 2-associated protein 1-like isoform X2 [Ctenocephalides felis]